MNFTQESTTHSRIPAGAKPIKGFSMDEYSSSGRSNSGALDSLQKDLARMGLHVTMDQMKIWAKDGDAAGTGMDAIQPTVTSPGINVPVQFLQQFLPGFVYIATAARKIDDLVGMRVVGEWRDEEVVQGVLEQTGTAIPYGDYTNVPLASWNNNWERRTIVRFEQGLKVGQLEQARSSAANIDTASQKRIGAMRALEIQRNQVGFFGYNNGLNRTYGFLNDPLLPAYIASPVDFSTATYLEIVNTLLAAFNQLSTQSQDNVDPSDIDTVLAISTNRKNFLATSTDFGYSVRKWLNEYYPKCRIVSAPQLNLANGGENVFYIYADRVDDESTDGGDTFLQAVPSKFYALGIQQLAKSYEEDYLNATAGIMLKRPFAAVRFTGI